MTATSVQVDADRSFKSTVLIFIFVHECFGFPPPLFALHSLCLHLFHAGMGGQSDLLATAFIPGTETENKEGYNVFLMERLLRILYSSCQYGNGALCKNYLMRNKGLYFVLQGVASAS